MVLCPIIGNNGINLIFKRWRKTSWGNQYLCKWQWACILSRIIFYKCKKDYNRYWLMMMIFQFKKKFARGPPRSTKLVDQRIAPLGIIVKSLNQHVLFNYKCLFGILTVKHETSEKTTILAEVKKRCHHCDSDRYKVNFTYITRKKTRNQYRRIIKYWYSNDALFPSRL